MTVIRFARHGAKKRPVFRIVVQNKTAPRDGRFIEHIGNYHPTTKDGSLTVKKDRLQYWLGVGAQASTSVKTHLRTVFAEFRPAAVPSAPKPQKLAAPVKKETAEKRSPKGSKKAPPEKAN